MIGGTRDRAGLRFDGGAETLSCHAKFPLATSAMKKPYVLPRVLTACLNGAPLRKFILNHVDALHG
jgi:hypothetical protein